MRQAHARGDWATFRARAERLSEFLNGSPDGLLEVARAEAQLGHHERAVELLREYAGTGQASDIVKTLKDFSPLWARPDFKSMLERMQSNLAPVSHSTLAFDVRDARLLPEDIDYDPGSRRFFLSSVLEHKLVTVDAEQRAADFARAPDDWPVLAIKVDAARRLVWATEAALDGFTQVSKADWGRSAVLCYDLRRGTLLRRIEGPRPSALGDMALDWNGHPVISDGVGGGVYLEQSGGLKRIDKGDFLSPQTAACTPDGKHVLVADYTRGVGRLEAGTGEVRWLAMEGKYALEGIDGMYLAGNKLIAVQNGILPQRVAVFELGPDLGSVVSARVMEGAAALDPTHGVMVGDAFYYIAHSGWAALDDAGNVKQGAVLTGVRILRTKAFD